jgi:signal transduction histidine kinase
MQQNPISIISDKIRHLSIKGKAFLVTTIILGSMMASAGIIIDALIRSSFGDLERTWIQETDTRIRRIFSIVNDGLLRTAYDYAAWSETCDYIQNSNRSYLKSNVTADVFKNSKLSGSFYFYTNGRMHSGYTLNDGEITPADREWEGLLKKTALHTMQSQSATGILKSGDQLYLLAAHIILHDGGTGPANGVLIHLRKIDNAFLQNLSDLAGPRVLISNFTADEAAARTKGNGLFFSLFGDETVDMHMLFRDLENSPACVFTIHLNRGIHAREHLARRILFIVFTIVLITSGILTLLMVNRFILSRLVTMISEVGDVKTTLDLSKRLEVKEWDEIDTLAGSINTMLDAIQNQKNSLDKAEKEKESLQEYVLQVKKMEAVGTLAGGIAHDFNNMLVSILGSAELLRLDIPAESPLLVHVSRIEKAGEKASALVRRMLTLGKGYRPVKTYFSVSHSIQEMLEMIKASLPGSITVSIQKETDDDIIFADIINFQQSMVNLSTNASHAMADKDQGSIRIRIREAILPSAQSRQETRTLSPGRYIQIEFRDSGRGIPDDARSKIFEPFFSTKPVGSGSGLGLSVVHSFVTSNNGSIAVESVPGEGTSFFIHLPCAQDIKDDEKSHDGKQARILLVDDDILVRKTLSFGLSRIGYSVIEAAGGLSAIKTLEDEKYSIKAVITDQMMPGMTGYELSRKIREILPGMPVILVSGYTSGLENSEEEKSFARIIMKPVKISFLGQVLDEILNPAAGEKV